MPRAAGWGVIGQTLAHQNGFSRKNCGRARNPFVVTLRNERWRQGRAASRCKRYQRLEKRRVFVPYGAAEHVHTRTYLKQQTLTEDLRMSRGFQGLPPNLARTFVTAADASYRLGISRERVVRQIARRHLDGKFDEDYGWMVSRSALERDCNTAALSHA
jgi:hypothetical protein